MSLALSTSWLARKLWRSCDVIKAPSVQPVFVYFFGSAQHYSINFGLLKGFHHKECTSKRVAWHRGCVRASHPAAPGSIRAVPKFYLELFLMIQRFIVGAT